MTTARDLVEHAFREIRVIGRGKVLSSDDAANGLYWLQNALDELAAENATGVPALTRQDVTLASGQSRYVYDASGGADIAARAPMELRTASLRDVDNRDWPVEIFGIEEYEAFHDKTQTGRPSGLYYEMRTALNVCPVPDAVYTLRIWAHVPATLPTMLSDAVTYPREWETLIVMRTALALAGPYGKAMSNESAAKLQRAEDRVLASTSDEPVMRCDDASAFMPMVYDIRTG